MEYYSVLGVSTDASDDEIRRAYRKLAMQWHPDKWTRTPSLLGEAKQKFQQIQEAYSGVLIELYLMDGTVLSDRSKRTLYDAGLYDRDDEEDDVEGFADFVQEMVCLMNDAREEEKNCSIEELQSMFWEMAQSFEIPEWNNSAQQPPFDSHWFCGPFSLYDSGTVGNNPWGATVFQGDSHLNKSSFETFSTHHFCR